MYKNRRERTEAKRNLADALNTTVKHVNSLGLCTEPLESVRIRAEKAEKAAEHREKCQFFAQKVVNRQISAEKAAKACDLSLRQMKRWIASITKEDHV